MEIRKAKSRFTRSLLRSLAWGIYLARGVGRFFTRKPSAPIPVSRIAVFVSMELLGGGVMISAIAAVLKAIYPGSALYIVGEKHRSGKLENFFTHHSCVDKVLICPVRGESTFSQWVAFYRELRRLRFDMCVLSPNHSCSNTVFLYLCGIPQIVGPYLPKVWSWHGNIENRFSTRQVTAEHLKGGRLWDFPEAYGRLFTGRQEFAIAECIPFLQYALEEIPGGHDGQVVVVHPGGLVTKRWELESFSQVVARLVNRYEVTVVIIGGPEEKQLAEALRNQVLMHQPGSAVVNWAGCSMNQTMNCIARAVLYLGNNAGTLQLAIALGTPVVGLYAEHERWFFGPDTISPLHSVVSGETLSLIPVDDVWKATDRVLEASAVKWRPGPSVFLERA